MHNENSHCQLQTCLIWALIQPALLPVETSVCHFMNVVELTSSSGSGTPVCFALLCFTLKKGTILPTAEDIT